MQQLGICKVICVFVGTPPPSPPPPPHPPPLSLYLSLSLYIYILFFDRQLYKKLEEIAEFARFRETKVMASATSPRMAQPGVASEFHVLCLGALQGVRS